MDPGGREDPETRRESVLAPSWVDDMGSLRATLGPSSTSRRAGLPPAHCPLAVSRADGCLRPGPKEETCGRRPAARGRGAYRGSSQDGCEQGRSPRSERGPVPPTLEGPGVQLVPTCPPFSPGGPSLPGCPCRKKKAGVSQWPLGTQASPTAVSSVRVRTWVPPVLPRSALVPPPFGPDPRWLRLLTWEWCRGAATAGDELPNPQTGPSPTVRRGPNAARALPAVGRVSDSKAMCSRSTSKTTLVAKQGQRRGTRPPRFPGTPGLQSSPQATQMGREAGGKGRIHPEMQSGGPRNRSGPSLPGCHQAILRNFTFSDFQTQAGH